MNQTEQAGSLVANQNEAESREEDNSLQPAVTESFNTNIVEQASRSSAKKNKR